MPGQLLHCLVGRHLESDVQFCCLEALTDLGSCVGVVASTSTLGETVSKGNGILPGPEVSFVALADRQPKNTLAQKFLLTL